MYPGVRGERQKPDDKGKGWGGESCPRIRDQIKQRGLKTVSQGSMWKECLDVPDLLRNLKLNQEIQTDRGTCALDENSVQGMCGLVCLCDHELSAISDPLEGPGDFLPSASNDQGS